MAKRSDVPHAEPTSPVATEVAPEAPATEELPPDPQPRWRRPALLVAGVSLLTLGAIVNADRFDRSADDRSEPSAELEQEDRPTAGGVGFRHKGEEGKMGKPSSKSKSGLYAMKGPSNAVPQMARSFDPDTAARNAGLLAIQMQNGNFLASPHGGAFAVGNDDEDVWGGLTGAEVGAAYGVGGLGLVGTGRGGGGVGDETRGPDKVGLRGRGIADPQGARDLRDASAERYAQLVSNRFIKTAADAKSTFSIDVDTASYANVRRFLLRDGQLPPPEAVRTEELINYFDYDYAQPESAPFSLTTEVGPCPWNPEHRLVHVGVQGKLIEAEDTPRRNLVFLLDVSGSMSSDDKLPLVKHGLAALTEQLGPDDRVSIVVYAGASGVVLPPTAGSDYDAILGAMDRLEAGGGTNGSAGIELAYELAQQNFVAGGVNRVLLATDGDFNLGVADHDALIDLIEQKRESGVFLSVLGVGTGNLNDHTMEQLADKGNGNYAYLDGMLEARKVLVAEAGATLVTIAKDVKIQVEFDADQVSEHRLVGYENRVMAHHEFDDDQKDAGEIGAGHSVTAIYEIAPTANAEADEPLMQLNLRYKQPDGEHSRKISVEVDDGGQDLMHSSNDYRFAAAVAAFAERLRGAEGPSYAKILELAEGSLGVDAQCYRHQFLELVWKAAHLSGETLARPESSCTPREQAWPKLAREGTQVLRFEHHVHEHGDPDQEWQAFVLEVLRLLPPFLALPLFVAALRRPRRKR